MPIRANFQTIILSSRKFATNFQAIIRSSQNCADNLPTVFCKASTSSSWWWWVLCFRRAWTSSASWTLRSYCCFIWRNLETKKYPIFFSTVTRQFLPTAKFTIIPCIQITCLSLHWLYRQCTYFSATFLQASSSLITLCNSMLFSSSVACASFNSCSLTSIEEWDDRAPNVKRQTNGLSQTCHVLLLLYEIPLPTGNISRQLQANESLNFYKIIWLHTQLGLVFNQPRLLRLFTFEFAELHGSKSCVQKIQNKRSWFCLCVPVHKNHTVHYSWTDSLTALQWWCPQFTSRQLF